MDEQYAGLRKEQLSTKNSMQAVAKRLEEQLNILNSMEEQTRNLADNTFGPQSINEPKDANSDVIAPNLSELVGCIERATSRLRLQLNRF